MSSDDYLNYLLLTLLPLWLLSTFCSPTLDDLLSTSLAMAKSSGLSVSDALYSFSGFLITHYLFKRFRPGNQVTTTSISWFTNRTSLSFNILGNAAQVSFNLRDLTSRFTIYCRDSIILFPQQKPTASSTRELACAVLYAIIIRGSLPSMLGNLMATGALQSWLCDLAGLVALVVVLAPSLVLPSAPHVSNVVNAIHLQESAEVSLQEERTLIQTPSPAYKKKKWFILVDRLPTPTHRTPRRPPLPSFRSPPANSPPDNSPNSAGDRIRPVIPLASRDAELSGANFCNTRDCPIEDSFSHLEAIMPVADRADLSSMNLPASRDPVGSRSPSRPERLDNTLPLVIIEPASEELSMGNDTLSLTDLLSGGPEDNLMENLDMGMILSDISGDGKSEYLSFMPEEPVVNASDMDRSLAALEEVEKAPGQVSTFDSPLAPPESEEMPTPMINPEGLIVQTKSVSITQQPECVPLITVSAVDDSYGANDTFSLTDVLSSFPGKEDDLLNLQEMRDDLANISMPQTHDSAAFPPEKVKDIRVLSHAETRGAPVAGPSTDKSVNKFVSSSKKRGHKRQRSDDIIYTPSGPFPLAKMPYELFSPASMRASEVASSLLSNEGRIRCADWRVGVDQGQQLLRVEQFAEEIDKDLAEFDKMQATLRSLMREHGLETVATPPRVPSVKITQASPESEPENSIFDRSHIIQRPYQFPAFLDKAVPLTIDFNVGPSSLKASESVDSMYDPDFPGLDGKKADKYPRLNSDWPSDFPTEADTSDEWKLTQEMIDFWAARKAKMEAENPPPPVNIDDLSMEADDGGEDDRTFADFEVSGDYNYEDEQCLPGSSRLKCLGWRYEVVPILPEPPQEPREHLVETVGNAILNQMCSVYSMYGKQDPDPPEEAPGSSSPPLPSPPRAASPLPEPFVEPSPVPASVGLKKSAPLRRQSTSKVAPTKVAPTTRVLRPRPSASASAKTAPPERPTADPNVLSKLRPRASIATSNAAVSATIEKKVVRRQSLPLSAPKAAPRQSLAQPSVAPKVSVPPKQSLVVPKAAPRQSLPQPSVAPKVAVVVPPGTTRQSLVVLKAVPRQSMPQPSVVPKVSVALPRTTGQPLAISKEVRRQSLPQSSDAPKISVAPLRTTGQPLTISKEVRRQSLPPQSSDAPKVSVAPPRMTRHSLAVPKAAPRQSLPQSTLVVKVSVAPAGTNGQSLAVPKAALRQSLTQSSAAPKVSITRQSLVVPKAVTKQSLHIPTPALKQTIAAQADSITTSTLKSAPQVLPKSTTSLPTSQTQTQPKSLAAVKRVPLAPIQTNVPRPSLPSATTTTTQKSISRLPPPKRMSLAPPPAQIVPGDAPKPSAPRPSLSRLPARRTSVVLRR